MIKTIFNKPMSPSNGKKLLGRFIKKIVPKPQKGGVGVELACASKNYAPLMKFRSSFATPLRFTRSLGGLR
jgi:hypothetical protein